MAETFLDVPAEAGEGQAILDDPGSTWSGRRPLPLEESTAERARVVPAPDVPGRRQGQRAKGNSPKAGRQCGSVPAHGGDWQGHQGTVARPSTSGRTPPAPTSGSFSRSGAG